MTWAWFFEDLEDLAEFELDFPHETLVTQSTGLLHLDDEEQFRPFQVAIVRAENGPDWFFLREKRAGQERRRLSLSGRGFARYKGLSQLFLPVEREYELGV